MKRFKGLQLFGVALGVFDYSVQVIVGEDKHQVQACVRWSLDDPEVDITSSPHEPRGMCFYRPGYAPILWIPKKPRTPREHATLAHEALHATRHAMKWAGIEMSDSSEEVFTHTMGHIVASVLEKAK